jgi:predicted nucleic acid-binding Zn ribbon protein
VGKPTTIKDALNSFLKGSGLETLLKNQGVVKAWQKVVGEEITAQTRIVGFRRGTLTVEVASSALYAELNTYYLGDLAASVREEMKSKRVRKIRLRLGQPAGETGDDNEKHENRDEE